MYKVTLNNGLRLIYKNVPGNLTSFTIGFEAGANLEDESSYGLAHVVEHMVYKGTNNYTESDINNIIDNIFGFSNAMTNYPYVVYYGTCLSHDFQEGFKLHSDILQNPLFSQNGFKEELDVIYEELKEWSEDLYQHCEDLCFENAFSRRRIKELIIGNKDSLSNITLENIREFHGEYYTAQNCVISVVSSLEFSEVLRIVKENFHSMKINSDIKNPYLLDDVENIYENNKSGTYESYENNNADKIQIIFPIHDLNHDELTALEVFNIIFGNGVSSLLYNEIRTKTGLAYEVSSQIKEDKGIKIFKIYLGTSKEKSTQAIKIIKELIYRIKDEAYTFTEDEVCRAIKILRLKKSIELEKSIIESVRLCTSEIMFGDKETLESFQKDYVSPMYRKINNLSNINGEDIGSVVKKVFKNATIQILH